MCDSMAGYIIYNGFWNTAPSDPVRRLAAAAENRGVTLTPVPNTAFLIQTAPAISVTLDGEPLTCRDFALFWDKDTRLAKALEDSGVRLYNSAGAVAACDDKSETHRILSAGGIPMPRTLLAPMTYTEVTAAVEPFLCAAEQQLGFPMVVKECYGSFGRQVYLAGDPEQLREKAYSMGSRPFLLQEFISSSAGEDTRLYMVGDSVEAAIRRRSQGDFRANVELGGTVVVHVPTEEETDMARRCLHLLGLHFGAVDFLHDREGRPLVCEVNSNAYMAGLITCTGVDIADRIVTYVLTKEETAWKI